MTFIIGLYNIHHKVFCQIYYLYRLYMDYSSEILSVALHRPAMQGQLELVHHKVQKIPGTVQYTINRYRKLTNINFEDTGIMVYNYKPEDRKESHLELIFCVTGNRYCKKKDSECNFC